MSITPKGVQVTLHQSLPNGNLGATLYVVLCSLLPAHAEALTGPDEGIAGNRVSSSRQKKMNSRSDPR